MEMLHSLRDQVLEGDTDVFLGDNPVALSQFLETAMTTYVQNWIHIWKPFILSSVKSATNLSI
jgi:GTP-dependent phosphoenolpyruvate carboxykinase